MLHPGIKRLACIAGVAAAALAVASASFAKDREVKVFNWSDYIDESILADFTKETGIKVTYDVFDSNEVLETKLLAGKTGYDIVVPTGAFLSRQIKAGVFQKLDKSKLTNIGNVWPEVAKRTDVYDPNGEHALTYMWGTTGIGYNEGKIKERLGDAPVNSWDLVFKPEIAAKFKDCGIFMLDSPDDILSSALRYQGIDPNTKDEAELKKGAELLEVDPPERAQVPFVGVHQRAGGWRHLHRGRLVGRYPAGPRPCRGSQERSRHQVFHSEGRRDDVV